MWIAKITYDWIFPLRYHNVRSEDRCGIADENCWPPLLCLASRLAARLAPTCVHDCTTKRRQPIVAFIVHVLDRCPRERQGCSFYDAHYCALSLQFRWRPVAVRSSAWLKLKQRCVWQAATSGSARSIGAHLHRMQDRHTRQNVMTHKACS